ncbi:MAG: 7TM diverse intracellular signaling domain-containing protein [Flavobacterium sp.]
MIIENILSLLKKGSILFFLLFYTTNYSQYVFASDNLSEKISLQDYTSVADVGQKDLDIQFVLKNFKTLNPFGLKENGDYLGFTKNNFWSMTDLVNDTNQELHYYFETARPITDLVELYIVNQVTGEIKKKISGDAGTYKDRSFSNRKCLFDLKIEPKANLKLVMHLKSDGEVVKLPLILYTPESFIKDNLAEQFLFGIFYGVLVIVGIIYLFFFIGLKESMFLYYSLYVVFIGLLQFALDGYFYQYITPNGGWFSNHAVLLFAIIGAYLAAKYAEVFFNIKQYSKSIYRVFTILYCMFFILLFCAVFIPEMLLYCYQLVNVLGLLFLFLIVFLIIYLYYKKKPVDSFYTIGIFFLIVGFGVFLLNNVGLIENTFLTQNSSKIGTGLEVIFLSLAMSNLIRKLKNEKEQFNQISLVKSEEMNELKTYFLSNISHELRTPLNAITNLIETVSNDVKDKKVKKNCEVIAYSTQSLLGSVNDILDFSKIEKNELRLEKKEFELLTVIKKAKYNTKVKSKVKGLKFKYTKPDIAFTTVFGDENRLFQILNNVLNNAIKFTSSGFIDFKVEVEKKSDTIASVKMIVTDSGVGIAKEKMERLFDSFSQQRIDNKRKFGGLGLGLYIVKTLVDMQGGLVTIESEVNKGTVCTITIDYEIVAPKTPTNIPIVQSEVYDLGGKTILVVEDNSMNQLVIKMITKNWLNTTVIFANNGKEGLEAFKDNAIDLVLMDLQMPVMDGYEATMAIRNGEVGAQNANIPIVAVTADVMENTKLRVAEIGMNYYISKPIDKKLLYKVIKELLN